MKLHDLSPPEGSKQEKNRKGRGCGARRGEACGKGNKGQKKRFTIHSYFEGGQTPLYRRIPKRGFNRPAKKEFAVVNVDQLNCFDEGEEISPEELAEKGLVDDSKAVKLLGRGQVDAALEINVHDVSEGARKKVEDAGGSVEIISTESRG
ncbi:MAG: 50S ribosomal protein L15 [bacterium]